MMERVFKISSSLLLIGSLILGIAGCAPTEVPEPTAVPEEPEVAQPTEVSSTAAAVEPTEAQEPVVIRYGITYEPDCFHPFACATVWVLGDLIWEGLTALGPNCEVTPRMAESIEVSDDGLTWYTHLRPGITYSDGEPFDAHTFEAYWDWLQTTEIKYWFMPPNLSVEWGAVDDLTFAFTTSDPVATYAGYDSLWLWPLAPHIWGETDDETLWDVDMSSPVATGPYVLTEWSKGDYLIFDANPDYYLGKPPIDRVVAQVFANWEAAVSALLGGDIDALPYRVPSGYYDQLDAAPDITVVEQPPGRVMELLFNMYEAGARHPAIADRLVREAIDYAIDKQQIIDVALNGHGILCPNAWYCGPMVEKWIDPSFTVTPYEPDQANQILDDAGYGDADGDGVRETADGAALEFRLFYSVDNSEAEVVSRMLKEWLAEVGIALEVEAQENATLQDMLHNQRDFDMVVRTWSEEVDPAIYDLALSCWSSEPGTGLNPTGFCNEEIDELTYAQLTTIDEDERIEIVYAQDAILRRERPKIYLAGQMLIGAYNHTRFNAPHDGCSQLGMLLGWYGTLNTTPVK